MQTSLQNTELEESLTQQAGEDDSLNKGFNPIEGELIDDGGEDDVQEDVSSEAEAQSDGSDSAEAEHETPDDDSDAAGDVA